MIYIEFTHKGERFAVCCEDATDANIVRSSANYCFGNTRIKKRIDKNVRLMTLEEFDSITDEIVYSE